MCGDIIEELQDCCCGVLDGFGLLGADGAESCKEFIVNDSCIVQE